MADEQNGWTGLLDELDRQLVRARRPLSVAVHAPGIWDIEEIRASFVLAGEATPEQAARASSLLRTYEMVVAEMQATKRGIGEQLAVLNALRAQQVQGPIYLDRVS